MADYETMHVYRVPYDANNVSNFGGDPVTQLHFKKRFKNLICRFVFQNMRSAGYHENMIGRTYVGGDQVTQLNLVLYNTIKWPYQPKHSPSFSMIRLCHKRFILVFVFNISLKTNPHRGLLTLQVAVQFNVRRMLALQTGSIILLD